MGRLKLLALLLSNAVLPRTDIQCHLDPLLCVLSTARPWELLWQEWIYHETREACASGHITCMGLFHNFIKFAKVRYFNHNQFRSLSLSTPVSSITPPLQMAMGIFEIWLREVALSLGLQRV